jgi:D-alanyl-D-alanine endopeptidase (penicillin-binding protein 7)
VRPASKATKAIAKTRPTPNRKQADGPELRSNAALVLDTGEGAVLFARNADKAMPIASLTKMMTSLVVLEKGLPLQEEIEIVREDRDGTRGAASRVAVGAKLSRGDLMHLALMASDNRAAHALGRTYVGGKAAMIEEMNRRAQTLGMTNTRFVDTSGLSSGNVASASDIAKLVQAVAKFATIREFSTDQDHSVVVLKHATRFRNTNYLVTKSDWLIDVQKTGFTNDAGQCLAMKAAIQGRSVVIVLLDSFGKQTRTADARRIRKWLEAHPAERVARAAN